MGQSDKPLKVHSENIEELLHHDSFIQRVPKGKSMRPLIVEGRDFVGIRTPTVTPKPYDVVFYRRGRKYILHRVIDGPHHGFYRVRGDNCFYTEYVPQENVIGVMESLTRNGKEVNLSGLSYRFYVYLWVHLYPLRSRLFRFKTALKKRLLKSGR